MRLARKKVQSSTLKDCIFIYISHIASYRHHINLLNWTVSFQNKIIKRQLIQIVRGSLSQKEPQEKRTRSICFLAAQIYQCKCEHHPKHGQSHPTSTPQIRSKITVNEAK